MIKSKILPQVIVLISLFLDNLLVSGERRLFTSNPRMGVGMTHNPLGPTPFHLLEVLEDLLFNYDQKPPLVPHFFLKTSMSHQCHAIMCDRFFYLEGFFLFPFPLVTKFLSQLYPIYLFSTIVLLDRQKRRSRIKNNKIFFIKLMR